MRFADAPVALPFTRQVTRVADGEFRPLNGPTASFDASPLQEPYRRMDELLPSSRTFRDGRGGFRTCDLSRVKSAGGASGYCGMSLRPAIKHVGGHTNPW